MTDRLDLKSPKSDTDGDEEECCDICIENGDDSAEAVSYCKEDMCCKKYCAEHAKYHAELLKKHQTISIADYKKRCDRLCSIHSDQRLQIGCRGCRQLLCQSCVEDDTGCEGHPHSWATLEDLKEDVKNQIIKLKKEVSERQKNLHTLSKTSEKLFTLHEEGTAHLIKQIENVRDAQLNAIQEKYSRLASELLTLRQVLSSKLTEFQESVKEEAEQLTNDLESFLSKADSCSEEDAAGLVGRVEQFLQLCVDSPLPFLEMDAMKVRLVDEGESREVELSIHTADERVTIGVAKSREKYSLRAYENEIAHAGQSSGDRKSLTDENIYLTMKACQTSATADAHYVNMPNGKRNDPTSQDASTLEHVHVYDVPIPRIELENTEVCCSACEGPLTNPIELVCKHSFCKTCVNAIIHSPQPNLCPSCKMLFEGSQPKNGAMTTNISRNSFQRKIEIHYRIPAGIQQLEHPNPGQPYLGKEHKFNMPRNSTGLWIANQLEIAFNRRAIFTVTEDKVEFNIPHPESKNLKEEELNRLARHLKSHLG